MKLSESEFDRLSLLLDEALELEEDARAAWIADKSEHDPDLARLLRLGLLSTSFLSPLSPERRAAAFADTLRKDRALEPAGDQEGDHVGPYRLLRSLGAGGMGTVWLAERADGELQRQVAIKLPRRGLAAHRMRELRLERDILASLEHPNIARLYDAGMTAAGQPFLTMEYVDGAPIDVYVREHALSVEAVLRLFLEVARAVAFAHRRLIVHRDLKPLNILVDKDGHARLLDFGIAKLLENSAENGAEDGQVTAPGQRALTPLYASPEQISGARVTVASDIYSLGIVLFELLTGARPYTLEQISVTAIDATETVVPIPLASTRASDPKLARRLRGDLDTILATALKRDPEQRYSSVDALAEDVERHLAGEPVHVRADSRWYRLRKFVRRNRAAVTATTLLALAIISGGAISLWQAHVATLEAKRAQRVKSFIASIFTQAQPRPGVGGAMTANELLGAAAERINNELAAEPAIAAELGVLIGESFSALGEAARGGPTLAAAVERADRELGRLNPIAVRGRVLLAESRNVSQEYALAEQVLIELVPDLEALLPATAADCVKAMRSLSFAQAKRLDAKASYETLKRAIAVGEEHLGKHHPDTVAAIGLLANTYSRFSEHELEMKTITEAVARAREAFETERPHAILTTVERWYAESMATKDRPAEAIALLEIVVRDQEAMDKGLTWRGWTAKSALANALARSGRVDEAIALNEELLVEEARLNTKSGENRWTAASRLAGSLILARSPRRALEMVELMEDAAKHTKLPKPFGLRDRINRAWTLVLSGKGAEGEHVAAEVLKEFGAGDEPIGVPTEVRALRLLNARLQQKRSIDLARRLAAEVATHKVTAVLTRARFHAELGRTWLEESETSTQAAALLNEAWSGFERAQVAPSVVSSDCAIGLARIDLQAKRIKEAEARLLPIEASWRRANNGSPFHGEVLYWLARAQEMRGEHALAAKMMAEARTALSGSGIPMFEALATK